jgi:hypothetical protein
VLDLWRAWRAATPSPSPAVWPNAREVETIS